MNCKHGLATVALALVCFSSALRAQDAKPLCVEATRACYETTAKAYFDGLLKADGSAVPFASDVRVTEQGRVVVTSRAAFLSEFKASGATREFRNIRMVVDEQAGEAALFLVADVRAINGEKPYTVRRGQRMKIVKGLIKEVELIYFVDPKGDDLWTGK